MPCTKKNSSTNHINNIDITEGKPKRPLSAYNLFFQHERAQILKTTPSKYEGNKPRRSHGKIGFASLARSVAAKWNNIDPETRKHFDRLAAEDKERYKREMEAWKEAQTLKQKAETLMNSANCAPVSSSSFAQQAFCSSSNGMPGAISLPTVVNAQSIVKCNLMAASQASQQSGRLVFSRFQDDHNGNNSMGVSPSKFVPASFFQNFGSGRYSNGNPAFANNATSNMRNLYRPNGVHSGSASAVVGQALALLEEDSTVLPAFQPLDEPTLERVESEELSSSSSGSSCLDGQRRSSGTSPHISELAAKLDDECLGFMSQFFC